jgi:DNA primase
LRRTGKNYIGFCPFHSNTRTPAFVVFPESQTWRCFGQCNEGGDLFGFVMKKEGWDFSETLRFLADKAGVPLSSQPKIGEADAQVRESLIKVLEDAAQFYRAQLFESESGSAALAYLRRRGLTDTTIKIWGLGYAPAGWDDLSRHLLRKGYTKDHLLRAGLITERDDGDTYDKFRHRLMFPIRDAYGKMAGFGGRVLNPRTVPKYLNSPRTELFRQGRYALRPGPGAPGNRRSEQAVLLGVYMVVIIGLHQAAFPTRSSDWHRPMTERASVKLLEKSSRLELFVWRLDPDDSRGKSNLRGPAKRPQRQLTQDDQPTFVSRGLLHFEGCFNSGYPSTTLPQSGPDVIAMRESKGQA